MSAMLTSCGHSGDVSQPDVVAYEENIISIPTIEGLDFDLDINHMSIQELRILRGFIYARNGVLLKESDLRKYFAYHTAWYDTLSLGLLKRNDSPHSFTLSFDEQLFIDRINTRIEELRQANYVDLEGDTIANVQNIVNMFSYPNVTQQCMDELAFRNFALEADSIPQLFTVYKENDSLQLPSFITTDLFLQLSHVYRAYILQQIEQEQLIPRLADLCLSLYQFSMDQTRQAKTDELKDIAAYNAAYFAIPYILLTGKNLKVTDEYQIQMEEELAYVAQQTDHSSGFLPVQGDFPYQRFQPYGHYTKTAELRRYFKAMKWLQLAPYGFGNKQQIQKTVFAAFAFNSQRKTSDYQSILGIVSFLTGQPALPQLSDLAGYLQKEQINTIEKASNDRTITLVGNMLEKLAKTYPQQGYVYCKKGIYFMPESYSLDAEVFNSTVDRRRNALRAFPRGLDVFAALGSEPAMEKLITGYREDTLWAALPDSLEELKLRFQKNVNSVSANDKWMECLLALQQGSQSPLASQNTEWSDQSLTTSLASWAKMKHDTYLYGKIPEYPEPSDTTQAIAEEYPPVTVAYVDLNLPFWQKLLEWVDLVNNELTKRKVMNEEMVDKTKQLREYITWMLRAARNESRNEPLTQEEYSMLNHLGSDIERLTLSMIEPTVDRWSWVAGDDQNVAVKVGVYERNIQGCNKNGVLYALTGPVNKVYMMVEINGFLYLTRGAVFNYTEFAEKED